MHTSTILILLGFAAIVGYGIYRVIKEIRDDNKFNKHMGELYDATNIGDVFRRPYAMGPHGMVYFEVVITGKHVCGNNLYLEYESENEIHTVSVEDFFIFDKYEKVEGEKECIWQASGIKEVR